MLGRQDIIMEMRKLENLGIETSLLGFGCMRFPTLENDRINEEESERLLTEALDAGVNYFDTAWVYHGGESESFIGKVLKKYPRDSFYLATKLPNWEVHAKEDAARIFEKQLERLQTDYIDFYLLHGMGRDSFDRMIKVGALDYCLDLQKQGKIKYLGFSFHDDYDAFEYIINYRDWDFCQIQLNYMDTEDQAGIKGYELATERGIPVIIMEPVKGGSLANLPEGIGSVFTEIDRNASIASWAFRFVGSLDNVKVILSGMSNMEQVKDNISIFDSLKPLEKMEEGAIEKVKAALLKRVKNGCTSCRYCMPCPAGVNIPENFTVWNQYHIYKDKGRVSWKWNQGLPENEKPKNCTECGACEEICPQKISIREHLKYTQQDMDELFQ